jgi:cobaltochelatase CobN
VFGSAPGTYGSGIEDLLGGGSEAAAVGAAYLASAAYAYHGGESSPAPGCFAERVRDADLLLHAADDPARDLLDGSADLAFVGGFAAAAGLLGRSPDLVILDTTTPGRPRPRSLRTALGRIVRGRLTPAAIAAQMCHGPRGAAELAELVDRLVGFAELTDAVSHELLDLVQASLVGDARVRSFLRAQNPAAAHAIADRLADARRRGWHPRRNEADPELDELRAEQRR